MSFQRVKLNESQISHQIQQLPVLNTIGVVCQASGHDQRASNFGWSVIFLL